MKKFPVLLICFVLMFPLLAPAQGVTGKVITLDVKDIDIADVIRMIADQSGMNIVASKNVQGAVSISLNNVPVEVALESILKVNNCAYIKEGDVLEVYTLAELKQKEQFARQTTRIFTLQNVKAVDLKPMLLSLKSPLGRVEVEPKSNRVIVSDIEENMNTFDEAIREIDRKMETKVYRLNYARPIDLQKNILGIIPATEGDVLVDDRTNSLVVTASPLLLNKLDVLIRSWDKQVPQVLIEAKIMQVTLEKGKFVGLDWKYQNPESYSVTVGAKDLPIPTGATYVEAFKIGVLDQDDYQVTLRTLEKSSDANLISSPSIVALENQEARILIGSSEPYEVFHYDAEGHVTGKELKFVEVGIKLTVIPKISDDGYITMTIHPEVSTPRIGTATNALAIDTTEATTVMTVKNGNTVALGGLIKDEKEKHIARVPILGEIPLIKYLFQNSFTKIVKKEIIIFITPHIIGGDRKTIPFTESGFSAMRDDAMVKAIGIFAPQATADIRNKREKKNKK
ncbi:MAG: secretin N-terminal domain-containing protein [Candidatus Omnitrophota bacterium]|jgi:type II secretory pathway component GspD/PulD (secretin)